MRKLLLLFFLTILPLAASALDEVEIDGIKYKLYENNQAAVTSRSDKYSGDIIIPRSIISGDVTYSVTSIGYNAFRGSCDLTSITIPNSVTNIESDAFGGCTGLKSISIPNSVTSISTGAFEDCSGLISVIIGNSVNYIGYKAFYGCKNMTSVIIGDAVTKIGDYAFYNCSSLTSLSIPNSVTSIGEYAFYGSSGITTITIGKSLTSVGSWAFSGCSGITSTEFHCKKIGNWFSDSKKTIVDVVIGDEVTSIGYASFYGYTNLTTINIPNSVTSIGYSAFEGCTGLSSVVIPNSVTKLDALSFSRCNDLKSVTIGNSVTSIEDNAFCECTSLTSVSIPKSTTSIGQSAFGGCSGLTSVTIPGSVTSIGNNAFDGCSGLTSVEIPNSVTSIGKSAFENCSNLASIRIPNTVTTCGYNAFSGTTWFENQPDGLLYVGKVAYKYKGNDVDKITVNIKDGTTEISDYAFSGLYSLTSVTIPNSVRTIGHDSFDRCGGLTTITIPSSVTTIKNNAFEGCSGLTSIFVDKDNNVYDSRGNCNAIIETSTNTLISGCQYTLIPNDVTSIGSCAFWGCHSLTTIIIPKSVISIGSDTFEHTSLTSVICLATEVPSANYSFFLAPIGIATLYVPKGCAEKYKEIKPWGDFGNIVEMDDLSIFLDCPPGEIRDAAIYLYQKGIVEGESGLLLADREATRAEVAKTSFYGAYFGPKNVPADLAVDNYPSVYSDLQDKTTYYYRPAKALLYLEYGDGVAPFDRNRLAFEPEDKMARVYVLKELMETFNIKPESDYISKAASLGIITSSENFRPNDNCTRGEAFLMLARIMQKIEAGEIKDPKPQESDYFQPLNTTLKTISLGASLQMGNFQHYTKTSFALNGVVPLAFAHSYNSYNTTLPSVFYGDKSSTEEDDSYQPLGDGWSHNYHSFVTVVGEYSSGTEDNGLRMIVHWGGGNIDVYKSEKGKLVPESMGVYDEITYDGGTELTITSKSQTKYLFSILGGSNAAVFYLSSITDRNGNKLTINYENGQNSAKRISSVSDGNRSLTFSYLSGTNMLSKVTDPLNRSVKFEYFDNKQTGKKQLKSFTDAENNTTTYDYADLTKTGTSKLLSRIQLPKGNYIENEYDANMRLKKSESGINGVPTTKTSIDVTANYGSNSISTQSQVNVERGSQTSSYHYTFNGNNVVTSVTGDKGLYVNSTYGDNSHPELPTGMENNSTNLSDIIYDDRGNVTSVTVSGEGTLTTTMTYDEMNNLTSITDPKGNKTTYNYDTKGNLVSVSAPEGVMASITVDSKGLPTETTSPMGIKTQYQYNEFGNVIKTTLPALSLSNSAIYDKASRLTSATDALGRTSNFVYNNNDFLTKETDAKNHITSYAYDKNDNLTSITNAKGGVTTMNYDNATDWLLSVEFAGATKQYTYNKDGSLNTFTKPDGTTLNYSYDELGRVISDGVNNYTYDNKLRLSSISGGGKTLSLSYDGFNRITSTSGNGHNNSYSYDKNGNCTSVNNTEYAYDGLNRLTSVRFSGKTIKYSYRKDSRLSKVEYPNGMTTTYDYDAVGRLTSKQTKLSNGKVIAGYSYTLNKVGNITEQTVLEPFVDLTMPDESVEYSYNNANRITNAGNISFGFDANGNTTKRGNETYTWDKQDRLTQAGSATINYDPLGLIESYGDITFTTDPLGIGNVLSDSKSGAQYIYGNGLEARVINGKMSYYVTDVRGSVVAIVDENGNITHKYQYDEFGKVTMKKEADYNPFQYVGKYGVMALNNHLYYMRARHYDPTIGRFLSEDPIWSTNLYPYADNNPIMGIDPEGLTTVDDAVNNYIALENNLSRIYGKNTEQYNLAMESVNKKFVAQMHESLEESLKINSSNDDINQKEDIIEIYVDGNSRNSSRPQETYNPGKKFKNRYYKFRYYNLPKSVGNLNVVDEESSSTQTTGSENEFKTIGFNNQHYLYDYRIIGDESRLYFKK